VWVVVASVATVLAAGACSSGDKAAEATVTACTPGPDNGRPVAEGQVTNGSSKTSNYTVRVGFYDSSGNKVTEGGDVVTDVEPATSSPWQATGAGTVKGAVTCRVLGVTRNVNPGG
jgi:hypothetical protein